MPYWLRSKPPPRTKFRVSHFRLNGTFGPPVNEFNTREEMVTALRSKYRGCVMLLEQWNIVLERWIDA